MLRWVGRTEKIGSSSQADKLVEADIGGRAPEEAMEITNKLVSNEKGHEESGERQRGLGLGEWWRYE
jgi:hypothetical protein